MTRQNKQKYKTSIFLDLLRQFLLFWALSSGLLLVLSLLYGQSLDLVLYFSLMLLAMYVPWFLLRWQSEYRGVQNLAADRFASEDFPRQAAPYQQRLLELQEDLARGRIEARTASKEQLDYFSLWAHQAKLPAAAMSLLLQEEEPDVRELQIQLQRLELYISMAMSYIRLHAESTDYVIRPVDPDALMRPVIRSFSSVCIRRRISIAYKSDGKPVLTDLKWMQVVAEQLLSNAIKYSSSPSVIRVLVQEGQLIIQDEGCGILPEDMPRVFERGFTGQNGRSETSQSSGIGLFLCREILQRLSHGFSLESEPGQGTTVTITFPEKQNLWD